MFTQPIAMRRSKVVSGVFALLTVFSACDRKSLEQVQTTAPVPVAVEAVRIGVFKSTISASGTIAPAPGAELIVVAPAQARVAEIPKAGRRVDPRS
jgi:hypothetical protein